MKISGNRFKQWPAGPAPSILLLFVCLAIIGCTGPREESDPSVLSADKKPVQNTSLAAIKSAPQAYENKVVSIAGVFKGWKAMCRSSFPLTRSDWILEDGTDCIVVSGRIPTGVSATNPKDEHLLVTGTLMSDEAGRLHLKALEIGKEPGMPSK